LKKHGTWADYQSARKAYYDAVEQERSLTAELHPDKGQAPDGQSVAIPPQVIIVSVAVVLALIAFGAGQIGWGMLFLIVGLAMILRSSVNQ
jgi:hypothetical protein